MKTHEDPQHVPEKEERQAEDHGLYAVGDDGAGPYHGERADEEIRAHDEGDFPFAIQDSSS
jgi:hypothetical protein